MTYITLMTDTEQDINENYHYDRSVLNDLVFNVPTVLLLVSLQERRTSKEARSIVTSPPPYTACSLFISPIRCPSLCYILFSLFPNSSIPLKCIFISGFSLLWEIDGNLVVARLLSNLSFFGEWLPWKRMPGCISLSKCLDRYSWLRAETGVGV